MTNTEMLFVIFGSLAIGVFLGYMGTHAIKIVIEDKQARMNFAMGFLITVLSMIGAIIIVLTHYYG